jgi:hypothetical protein
VAAKYPRAKHRPAKPPFAGPQWIRVRAGKAYRDGAGDTWTYDRKADLWRWTCTDAQWQTVLDAAGAQHDSAKARAAFNKAASDYLCLSFYHRVRFPKGSRPAQEWRQLVGRLEAAKRGPAKTDPAFIALVDQAIARANIHVISAEMEGRNHHHGKSPERNGLHRDLLDIWTRQFNGDLTTGRPDEKGAQREANSPATLFLVAALALILDEDDRIGPERAEQIIEAEIALRPQLPKMTASWMKLLKAMQPRAWWRRLWPWRRLR